MGQLKFLLVVSLLCMYMGTAIAEEYVFKTKHAASRRRTLFTDSIDIDASSGVAEYTAKDRIYIRDYRTNLAAMKNNATDQCFLYVLPRQKMRRNSINIYRLQQDLKTLKISQRDPLLASQWCLRVRSRPLKSWEKINMGPYIKDSCGSVRQIHSYYGRWYRTKRMLDDETGEPKAADAESGPDVLSDDGPDTRSNAESDVGPDDVPEVGLDARSDDLRDAGPDTSPDAGSDAGSDDGPDADQLDADAEKVAGDDAVATNDVEERGVKKRRRDCSSMCKQVVCDRVKARSKVSYCCKYKTYRHSWSWERKYCVKKCRKYKTVYKWAPCYEKYIYVPRVCRY